jgi:hypothetical protein
MNVPAIFSSLRTADQQRKVFALFAGQSSFTFPATIGRIACYKQT